MKPLKNIAKSIAALVLIGTSAHATVQWDVDSDSGSFSPVGLGSTVEVSACGSTFYNSSNQSQSYSLCQLSDLSKFSLQWRAFENSKGWYDLAPTFTGANAANGLGFSFATGAGTFFNTVGTYMISLHVFVADVSNIPLPGNGVAFTGYGHNNDFDITNYNNEALVLNNSAPTGGVVSVPEPEALFVLIPGLALMGLRERRRRRKHAAAA